MSPLPGRLVLLGHPVSHSFSPAFQNAALERASLPIRYETIDVTPDALDDQLDRLIAENAWGNVTIPHKEHVARRCARRTEIAERVGAVNTFWIEDGALAGDNTDVGGFLELLAETAPDIDTRRPATLLGAGGAAAGVVAALEQAGFGEIRIHARSPARAASLGARFAAARITDSLDHALKGAALLVNATPVGLDFTSLPIDVERIDPDTVVLDLIAGAHQTPFVRAARSRGLRAADGMTMLLAQGALSFQRWFGIAPDRAVMRQAVGR